MIFCPYSSYSSPLCQFSPKKRDLRTVPYSELVYGRGMGERKGIERESFHCMEGFEDQVTTIWPEQGGKLKAFYTKERRRSREGVSDVEELLFWGMCRDIPRSISLTPHSLNEAALSLSPTLLEGSISAYSRVDSLKIISRLQMRWVAAWFISNLCL